MEREKLNLVLIPPAEAVAAAQNLSSELHHTYNTKFIVGQQQTVPHISLYQATYPVGVRTAIIATVDIALKNLKPFGMTLAGLSHFQEFVFWDAVKTPELTKLHTSIVEALNPLRSGELSDSEKDALASEALAEEYKENIRTYGYLLAYEQFQPHVTLTVAQNVEDAQTIIDKTVAPTMNITASRVALTNVDEYGTVTEILHEWLI